MDNLTPEASALRAFTVMPICQDDTICVLRFLSTARILDGSLWSDEDRAVHAHSLLLKWVALSVQHHGAGSPPGATPTLREAAQDAAAISYWLRGIEPIEGESFNLRDDVHSGLCRILELIERLLQSAAGTAEDPSAADHSAADQDAAPSTQSRWSCEAKAVQAFVDAARPHSGTDFSDDQRLKDGERLIRRYAAHLAAPGEAGRYMPIDGSDASSVLHFLASVEPVEGVSFCDGGEANTGQCVVLHWISTLMLQPPSPLSPRRGVKSRNPKSRRKRARG
jgi:hypothetical protein